MSNSNAKKDALQLLTIGAFGYDETSFFDALHEANVDTFCDIRQRRGVRGSKYAFVNSKRLQKSLVNMGIRYVHIKELAPTKDVREAQKRADRAAAVAKRERKSLSRAFVDAYECECLTKIKPADVLSRLPENAKRVVLFCVEEQPRACHRSVAADWLSEAEGLAVAHLTP